jgi:capsular polysaccharide biosynthesis protein
MNSPPHEPLSLTGIHAAGMPGYWARKYNEEVVVGAGDILWRRRWTIVCSAAAALVLASIFLILKQKEYTAETLLRLDFNSSRAEANSRINLDPAVVIESEARIIRSRAVAERVVTSENLEAKPEFSAPAGVVGGAIHALKSLFGADGSGENVRADSAAATATKKPSFQNAVAKIMENSAVESDNKSYLIAIRFQWASPEMAARIANAISESYLRERQLQNLAEEASRLKAELSLLEQRIGERHPAFIGTRGRLASVRDQIELLRREEEPVRNVTVASFTAIPAVPALPPLAASAPKPAVVYGLTLLVCLVGASALVLLLERRNGRVELEDMSNDALGVRCFGMVPRPDTHDVPCLQTILTETVRSIAAAAALEAPSRRPTVVLITSSVPDEDKTLFTASLARVLSEAGRRVLVVDTVAQVRASGDAEINPVGSIEPPMYHTASLTDRLSTLWGDGLEEFLLSARKTHEVILIKAPPVLLLADSIRLARLSDTVILLARWRSTRVATVANAIRILADAGIQVSGLVVTNVNLSKLRSWPTESQCYYLDRYGKFYASLSS